MDMVTWVQILAEAVCISHSADTFGKDMHSSILFPANSRADWAFNLGLAIRLDERKLNSKPLNSTLKNGPCVTFCVCGGVGEYIYIYIYICLSKVWGLIERQICCTKENGKKNTYKWMRKNLLLNINLDPLTCFDKIFKIWNYENFR